MASGSLDLSISKFSEFSGLFPILKVRAESKIKSLIHAKGVQNSKTDLIRSVNDGKNQNTTELLIKNK
jgi:hypothetical protein